MCVSPLGRKATGVSDDSPCFGVCRIAALTFTRGPKREERVVARVVIDAGPVLLREVPHGLEHRPIGRRILTERNLAAVRTPRASVYAEDVTAIHMQCRSELTM